jgi:hypothetical protein
MMWSSIIQDPFRMWHTRGKIVFDDLMCGFEKVQGNWPIEEEVDIACGCKERNFWNYAARVLGSVIEPDEATAAVLWCGDL